MLIENAIKHNIITETKPLQITVTVRDNYLVVQNNLREKKLNDHQSNKSGLLNIQRRYAHFSEKKVDVIKGENTFTVKSPTDRCVTNLIQTTMKILIFEDEKPASDKLIELLEQIDSNIEVVGSV